jgi:acyl-CoA thioester hydrolase
MTCLLQLRVPYADTDQMGMVYYANYLVYFERGRTEWLREHGLAYRDLEARGLYFPVVESVCAYHAPARYDDLLDIRTTVAELSRASVTFGYEITRGTVRIASGSTRHPLVNRTFRPIRIPDEIRRLLERPDAEKNCCCR